LKKMRSSKVGGEVRLSPTDERWVGGEAVR